MKRPRSFLLCPEWAKVRPEWGQYWALSNRNGSEVGLESFVGAVQFWKVPFNFGQNKTGFTTMIGIVPCPLAASLPTCDVF